jgi:hypothetical protein
MRVVFSLLSLSPLLSFSLSFYESPIFFHEIVYSSMQISASETNDRLLSSFAVSSFSTVIFLIIGRFVSMAKHVKKKRALSLSSLSNENSEVDAESQTITSIS